MYRTPGIVVRIPNAMVYREEIVPRMPRKLFRSVMQMIKGKIGKGRKEDRN